MAGKASQLIGELNSVPSIIGGLGLAIADAQKALNLEYLENIERLLTQIKMLLDHSKLKKEQKQTLAEFQGFIKSLLMQLAPSRYQFSETTLAVKMDLGQSLQIGGTLGLGGTVGAVVVNASLTVGYGYDYRAAAEVRTVLHAIPPDEKTFSDLLSRAESLSDKLLTLPPGVDLELANKSRELIEKIGDLTLPKPKVEEEPPTGG